MSSPDTSRLREWLTLLGSILVPSGVLLFAIQYATYQSFYGSLGIDPSDVGLSYARVLAGSTQLVLWVVILPTLGALLLLAVLAVTRSQRLGAASDIGFSMPTRRGIIVLAVFFAVATSIYPIRLLIGTGSIGSRVRAGKPFTYNGQLVPIHADPVTVQAVGKPDDAPTLKALSGRKHLLYLGQSNGVIVIYDPDGQHSIFLPSSAVMITVSNCRSKLVDDSRCSGVP